MRLVLSNYPCSDCISRRCSKASCALLRPDDHFTAGPDCRVTVSAEGALVVPGGCPRIRAGIVSPAGVRGAPGDIHPKRSFHCRSRLPCDPTRAEGALLVLVAVQRIRAGIVSARRCSNSRCSSILSAPDDHFTAGPDCRVISSASRARWWCWWLSNYPCWDCISRRCSDSLTTLLESAPNDHFTAGPNCRVTGSGNRGVSGGRSRPRIICARRIPLGNFRKSVDNLP